MNNEEIKFEDKIMSEINTKGVKIRSKYVFLAEKLGFGSGLVLSVFLSILLINSILFYVASMGYFEYLRFGRYGILAFLEALPYMWILGFIAFFVLAIFIFRKYDISYKKPFIYMMVALFVLIVMTGSLLAASSTNKKIDRVIMMSRVNKAIFDGFYGSGLRGQKFGVVGVVLDDKEGILAVQTQQGVKLVRIGKDARLGSEVFKTGDVIVGAGRSANGEFEAVRIKRIDKSKLPLIRQRMQNLKLDLPINDMESLKMID